MEELGFGRLVDFEAGVEVLRPDDQANRKTYEANHNANTIENILNEFRTERMRLVQRLESYDDAFAGRAALHPRLNMSMRVVDLVYFIAEHDDHHLAQIAELIRRFERHE